MCSLTALQSEIRQKGGGTPKLDTSCGTAVLVTLLTYCLNDLVSEREVASGMTKPLKGQGFSLPKLRRITGL
jgi:predicted double-glycine peptidase